MKVILVGLPLFSKRLADDLNQVSGKNEYVFLDTYNSKWAQLKCLLLLPFAKGVFSMNGVSDNSGILNWVVFFKKKLWMQWVGTDVANAVLRHQNKSINRNYIDHAFHATDATWLQDELKMANIQCVLNNYKYLPKTVTGIERYSTIEVVSYIPQGRQEFYGMEQLTAIAKLHPSIQFHVFGLEESNYETLNNVICHGWQNEQVVYEQMKKSAIFLRLTEHDGFSVSVVEAFCLGCEVVATNPFPFAHHVTNNQFIPAFENALNAVTARGMKSNSEAKKYYLSNFDKEQVMRKLYNELHAYFG